MGEGNVRLVESRSERRVLEEPDIELTPEDHREWGIRGTQSHLSRGLEELMQAEKWSKNTTAVPDHIRPQITHLVQKCRLLVSELENMK